MIQSQSLSDVEAPPASTAQSALARRLVVLALGAVLLLTGGLLRLFRPEQDSLASLFGMLAMLSLGAPVLWDAITSMRVHGFEATRFYMDQFIALALAACFAAGEYFTGSIVAIVLISGELLEERSMIGVQQAVRDLLSLTRVFAQRLTDSGEERVDSATLRPGDTVRVRPGDTVPADGKVVRGTSTIDQASVTGESLPVDVSEGGRVFAGTANLTGSIDVAVERSGEATLIGRAGQIVLEAQQSRAPIIRLTEEYASYYTPMVLLLAGFVLFFTSEIQRAISVIIVSIPCAFVLAGPSTMIAALATASRLGILVKSVRFFETASQIDTVVFDKTGTLTHGQLSVAAIRPSAPFTESEALALAAAVECHSRHPVAKAITHEARRRELALPEAESLREVAGQGIEAQVDRRKIRVGRLSWIQSEGVAAGDDRDAEAGTSALGVAVDDRLAAIICLRDNLRDEARNIGRRLGDLGVRRFLMVTGDHKDVARRIADEVGFSEVIAETLPEEKLAVVRRLKQEGHRVAVVGDGINDAPALAAGDLSVAMGALGSDLAIQTADVALMHNDLHRLPTLIRISRSALHLINQNLLCGLIFIGIAIITSAAGWVSPIAAAFIHEFSAFFVIFNGARLLRFDEPKG
ncbi:MAG TPA: cation-translocating P-type ATPase [Verrucomicrobiae bacterium]|nr:cation-translocating P-type ATPase [Verrucomicrobiae bacterium]